MFRPVFLTVIVLFLVLITLVFTIYSLRIHNRSESWTDKISCPHIPALENCTNSNFPVLGGVDVISLWGSQHKIGKPANYRTHDGYKYHFESESNANMFSKNPSKYIPQFGGFCSWGMSNEGPPTFVWTSNCLGPSCSLNARLIYKDKLYLFLHSIPRSKFTRNIEANIKKGEARMREWFGTKPVPSNTTCIFSDYKLLKLGI
tara:strand:- start:178 stop:786 length:609 start_codon:yes stop_codon:yes gene_type:complete